MCGRFSLEFVETFYRRYSIKRISEIKSNFNVSPYSYIPVVIRNSPQKLEMMKWGFVPSWSKELNSKYAVINTRAETIDEKPYFKAAFKHSRCLIPASGFYEWRKDEKEKVPFHFKLKDKQYFSFAGIYSIWKDAEEKEFYTCSVITTKPNELMEPIHNRMPVILSEEEEDIWVDKTVDDEGLLKSILDPYPAEEMERYEVSREVNSTRSNGEDLAKPV